MNEDEYLINELAKRADVTVRTIRYYQDQGLLSAPDTRGRYALYNKTHLEQLQLIKKLKALHLPLDEIRRIMSSAGEGEIRRRLEAEPPTILADRKLMDMAPSMEAPGKAALEYLEKISSSHKALNIHRMELPEQNQTDFMQSSPLPQRSEPRETWNRILLAPGVELMIYTKADPKTEALVQELVRFAQQLFSRL